MKELKKHAIFAFEIKSDLKTRFVWEMPPSFLCMEYMSAGGNFSAMIMSVYTMSVHHPECLGDMKTIHHPEVTTTDTYTFFLFIKSPYLQS